MCCDALQLRVRTLEDFVAELDPRVEVGTREMAPQYTSATLPMADVNTGTAPLSRVQRLLKMSASLMGDAD